RSLAVCQSNCTYYTCSESDAFRLAHRDAVQNKALYLESSAVRRLRGQPDGASRRRCGSVVRLPMRRDRLAICASPTLPRNIESAPVEGRASYQAVGTSNPNTFNVRFAPNSVRCADIDGGPIR